MIKNGEILKGKISDMNEDNYFVQIEGVTYKLSRDEFEESLDLNDIVEGMIYEDKDRKNRMTTILPDIRFGVFGWATVVDVRKDLGVFMDIGLKNKDIVVSLDDLPDETYSWPKKGDRLYISLKKDTKNRLWGALANEEILHPISTKANKFSMNQNTNFCVYRTLTSGAQVITENNVLGYIHNSEMLEPLRLGQEANGRVIDIHINGTINLSTKPRAHEAITDDAQMIYMLLTKSQNHFLPYHDKSDANDIKEYFGISKGQFKRAVGNLLKERKIKQVINEGIYLITDEGE